MVCAGGRYFRHYHQGSRTEGLILRGVKSITNLHNHLGTLQKPNPLNRAEKEANVLG